MKILDACCGSRMFYFDKEHSDVTFMDLYPRYEELKSGHIINCQPDVVADFTNMPFENDFYDLVIFDPPHLIHVGQNSWLFKKYGKLNKENWTDVIKQGFNECMRVLKPTGTLIFKWNEEQIEFSRILKLIDKQPLLGDKRGKTRWVVFVKEVTE